MVMDFIASEFTVGKAASIVRAAPVVVVAAALALAGSTAAVIAAEHVEGAVAAAKADAGGATGPDPKCLALYRWQPRVAEEKCATPATEVGDEAVASPDPAPAGGGAPAAAEQIGSTTVVVKTVTGEMEGAVYQLVSDDNVHQDEIIETAVSSASEIIFLDDTKISLGPNTRLTLDQFVFDPDPKRGKFVMTTVKGVFRFVSGNMSKESYVIKTPTVTIGVRGTVFTSVTRDDGSTVVILQCPVCTYGWQPDKQRQCLQRNTSEVTVESLTGEVARLKQCGMATTVFADGSVTEPGPPPDWAVASLEELDDLVGEPSGTGENTNGGGTTTTTTGGTTGGGTTPGGTSDDTSDNSSDDTGDDTGGKGNRSGHADGSNPGKSNGNNGGTSNPGGGKKG